MPIFQDSLHFDLFPMIPFFFSWPQFPSQVYCVLERNGTFYNRCFPWCLLPRGVCPSSCFVFCLHRIFSLHPRLSFHFFFSLLPCALCLSLPPHFFYIRSFYLNRLLLFDSLWHGGGVEILFGSLRMREWEKCQTRCSPSCLHAVRVCFHCRLQDSMLSLLLLLF